MEGQKMAEYRSLKDFKPEDLVTYGDVVYLANIRYEVGTFTLYRNLAKADDEIFKLLKIKDKVKYCEEVYGYKSDLSMHGFPHFESNDYVIATRIIKKLMATYEFKKRFNWFFGIKFPKHTK